MSYLTLRSSYIYFALHLVSYKLQLALCDSYYADVALGENEFDTSALHAHLLKATGPIDVYSQTETGFLKCHSLMFNHHLYS